MVEETVTLPVSIEKLRELVITISRDFGFDYGIQDGLDALKELCELLEIKPEDS